MSERYLFRKPTGAPQDRGASPPRYRRETGPGGMIIERDVPVPVRGGVTVYADVFRPAGERPAPPLDQGLHTRGTFEGFTRIGSQPKWLDAHGGKKWGYYYSADGLRRQQAFFDHLLLGRQTEISDWPRVRYQVRDTGHEGAWKTAADWPVPGTSYQPL